MMQFDNLPMMINRTYFQARLDCQTSLRAWAFAYRLSADINATRHGKSDAALFFNFVPYALSQAG
jgi:hypothetical protein